MGDDISLRRSGGAMQYWWVSHNKTYQIEIPNNFLWSPKTQSNGYHNQFYANMAKANVGDLVFSYRDTWIKSIGIVAARAETSAKPEEFREVDNPWLLDGWLLRVNFTALENPIRPRDYMD